MFLGHSACLLPFSQCIVRVNQYGLGLAMVPGIMAEQDELCSSIGNRMWALAGMISLQFDMTGVGGIFAAMVISIPFSILAWSCV